MPKSRTGYVQVDKLRYDYFYVTEGCQKPVFWRTEPKIKDNE